MHSLPLTRVKFLNYIFLLLSVCHMRENKPRLIPFLFFYSCFLVVQPRARKRKEKQKSYRNRTSIQVYMQLRTPWKIEINRKVNSTRAFFLSTNCFYRDKFNWNIASTLIKIIIYLTDCNQRVLPFLRHYANSDFWHYTLHRKQHDWHLR